MQGINTTEMVQRHAACFATHNYMYMTHYICHQTAKQPRLDWPSLLEIRRDDCLALFSKAANGHSAISLSHLTHPTRYIWHPDNSTFIPVSTRTDIYKYSFPPRVTLNYARNACDTGDLVSAPSCRSARALDRANGVCHRLVCLFNHSNYVWTQKCSFVFIVYIKLL